MRWKSKGKHGDKRIIRKFMWFPFECSDGYVYWLQFLEFEQELNDIDGLAWVTHYSSGKYVPPPVDP